MKREPGRNRGEQLQLLRSKNIDEGRAYLDRQMHGAGRKPMHGTGTSGQDIWRPDLQSVFVCTRVDDERRGKMFCHDCAEEIVHVELDGKYSVRNLDGLPHALTCEPG